MRESDFLIAAVCGGRGVCGKCRVKIINGVTEISSEEQDFFSKDELSNGFRLACIARIFSDVEIIYDPIDKGFEILSLYKDMGNFSPDNFELICFDIDDLPRSLSHRMRTVLDVNSFELKALRKIPVMINRAAKLKNESKPYALTQGKRLYDLYPDDKKNIYGIAIDIGTTTICFGLINLISGAIKSTHSRINSQRGYGADIISRIKVAGDGKLLELRNCIAEDIIAGIKELLNRNDADKGNIYQIVIAANTTMVHILLGIPCESLGVSPFTSTLTDSLELHFSEIFESSVLDCNVQILPSVSAYVGGDIVSGIFFCGAHRKKSLFVDIGTNCEMAVTDGKNITCAAAAAGPAFEGGNISCGTGSIPGAISKCRYENSRFIYEVIGSDVHSKPDNSIKEASLSHQNPDSKDILPPCGICGSGLMDAVGCMLENGMIDETGRLADEYSETGVEIAPGVVLTQRDIRELQLAKSAMRAGIEILLKESSIKTYEEIETVYLSGSFGYNMDIHSAVAIGLIPSEFSGKIVSVGNSSLGGCVQVLLKKDALKSISEIAALAREINLSENIHFNELFAEHMLFILNKE